MSDTVAFVEECLKKAKSGTSKINQEILGLDGMSDPPIRHLLNNLCERPDTRYLEIGIWKGSVSISALYKNSSTVKSVALIDNYSINYEDTIAAKNTLISNIDKYLVKESGYKEFSYADARLENISDFGFYNIDSFCLEAKFLTSGSKIPATKTCTPFAKRNIYVYDGRHTEEGQFRALTFYDHALEDEFIYIVDDWNLQTAKDGTRQAFATLNYNVKKEWELPFYNGYYVGVIEKNETPMTLTCPKCQGNEFSVTSSDHNVKSCQNCNWSFLYR